MSLDFYVYSPDDVPIEVCSLRAAAADANWELFVLRDWSDWNNYCIVKDGPLVNGDDLCGWSSKDVRAAGIAEALEKRFGKVIERFSLSDAIGQCTLFIESAEEYFGLAGFSEAEREAIAKHGDADDCYPSFLEGVFKPKLVYCLNTKAIPCNGELFEQAGRWIASVCRGAWDDPQSDDHGLYCSSDNAS